MTTHTNEADTTTEKSDNRVAKAPTVTETGSGYQYVRCQRFDDVTIYIHQLAAIAGGAGPYEVFSDDNDVHHRPLDDVFDLDADVRAPPVEINGIQMPAIDTPAAVELRPRNEHRKANLRGVGDD